ncbi:AfsR/SARP family transcriptional regulator [Tamaricihabitans halophyticus]|uniref:AfsR/SARP family transcriptional regulator n=1 Tax=Tamaricihabitans halophyticus TaxID=1262583 RepID=UPI0014053BC2|nr:BTAD domain-containing putative transcriptional regulator [Tamaricihabitans halophyticus]
MARAAPGGRAVLVRDAAGYRLDAEVVRLDATELRERLAAARSIDEPGDRAAELAPTRALWRGQPYGEFGDEPWAIAEVSALVEVRLQAVEMEAAARLDAGDAPPALAIVAPFLPEYPMRESLVAVAMHAAYAARRMPEALRLYERLRTQLAEELGVDPGEETQRL